MACDLLDAARLRACVETLAPQVVIHTQALSDVDRCEREPEAARAQNVETTRHLVEALRGSRALLVHISTDYVFDGRKGTPYEETDAANPLSVYGRTKLESEGVARRHPRTVVVRIGTLFGEARMNFCDYLATQLRAGRPVEAFADQVTSPTYADDVAQGLEELLQALGKAEELPAPVCHMANAGGCSRVRFAERIAELMGCSRSLIRPVPMASQRRPAQRPAFSAMTTSELPRIIGRTLRPWDDALCAYLSRRSSASNASR